MRFTLKYLSQMAEYEKIHGLKALLYTLRILLDPSVEKQVDAEENSWEEWLQP